MTQCYIQGFNSTLKIPLKESFLYKMATDKKFRFYAARGLLTYPVHLDKEEYKNGSQTFLPTKVGP